MVDGLRVGRRLALRRRLEHALLEAPLRGAVVGRVVRQPMRVRRAVARDHRDGLGRDALEPLQEVGVDAHLDDRGGLHPACELGIRDVVAVVAEVRRPAVPADEEVRVAAPATVEEGGLEDDVVAAPHRGQRLVLGRSELIGRVRDPQLDLVDAATLVTEAAEIRLLVVVAASADELELRIVPKWFLDRPGGAELLERDQMVALEEADEIGGGDDQRAVGMQLHGTSARRPQRVTAGSGLRAATSSRRHRRHSSPAL